MANATPEQWAVSLLGRLGIKRSPGAVQALVGWARAEGGHWNNSARFNPLNTTQEAPGAGNTGSQGNIKVYRSWDQGLQATVETLRNGRYAGILAGLRAGSPAQVADAIGRSPWGTSASLARQTILHQPAAEKVLHGLSGVPFDDHAASPGTRVGMRVVNTLKTGSALDTRSFEDAKRLSIVGRMLASRHGTDSPLFRSGVLSTQAPNPADFMRPTLTGSVSAVGTGTGTTSSAGLPHGHSPLFELFWQGPNGINAKNGQREPQGFVSGHTDHVHVAAGPNTVVALGRMAQKMGLHVGENPKFGGVNPVHAKNSFHYRGEAIDVSGDTKLMARYAHTVARRFGVR